MYNNMHIFYMAIDSIFQERNSPNERRLNDPKQQHIVQYSIFSTTRLRIIFFFIEAKFNSISYTSAE